MNIADFPSCFCLQDAEPEYQLRSRVQQHPKGCKIKTGNKADLPSCFCRQAAEPGYQVRSRGQMHRKKGKS